MTTLRAVPTPLDPEGADVVVLRAPGKRVSREHPVLGPLRVRMKWTEAVHQLMLNTPGMSLYEADQIVTGGFYDSHDGKGRKFQPAGQR